MSKEKIEKIIDEMICEKIKITYNEKETIFIENKAIKKLIFNKILPEVFKELIDNKSLIDKSNGRYNRECELREKIKKLYNIEL